MAIHRREFLRASGAVAASLAMGSNVLAEWEPSPRYPDPLVKVIDPSFGKYRLGLAKVEMIACRPQIEAHPENREILGFIRCQFEQKPKCYACRRAA